MSDVVVTETEVVLRTQVQLQTVVAEPTAQVVVQRELATEFVEGQNSTVILEVSRQGPPGPAGVPGEASGGENILLTAGPAIGGHRIVLVDGLLAAGYASKDDLTHIGRVYGVTLNAAGAGEPVTVRTRGAIEELSWAWTPLAPVFLGVNGLLTQTVPTSGFQQVIGVAITATVLFVNPREPIVLT